MYKRKVITMRQLFLLESYYSSKYGKYLISINMYNAFWNKKKKYDTLDNEKRGKQQKSIRKTQKNILELDIFCVN